eukprot:1985957-Pyramimonas_sp.AAC.1
MFNAVRPSPGHHDTGRMLVTDSAIARVSRAKQGYCKTQLRRQRRGEGERRPLRKRIQQVRAASARAKIFDIASI